MNEEKVISLDRGQWVGDKWLYPNSWGWNINMSSTLTELIHIAGRYVDAWASDLFIFWKFNIENKEVMQNKDWKDIWYIGFRNTGIDWDNSPWEKGNKVYDTRKHNSYEYRRIVKLSITPNGSDDYKMIDMKLTEVA